MEYRYPSTISGISKENIPGAFKTISIAIEKLTPEFFYESEDYLDKLNSNEFTFSIGATYYVILFEPSNEILTVIKMVNPDISGTFIQTISIKSVHTLEWLDTLQQTLSMVYRYPVDYV